MSNIFLTNTTEVTFVEKIRDNLRQCTAFCFSVSFIKKAGLVLLFKDIEAAIKRGCAGKIITSTYQNFTDIEFLKSFFALASRCPNFECHLDYESFHDEGYATRGFHSKGYLFDFGDHTEVIIGSSNITRYALLKNIEWDVSVNDPELYKTAMAEFDELWNATHVLNQDIINLYSTKLNFAIERWDMDYDFSVSNIKPNFMQRKAFVQLLGSTSYAPPLTVPPVFADGQSRRESPKMASRPFQFLEKNAPKSERVRPSTLKDWPPCPPRRQRHFHGNADRAYNTLHIALQSRVPEGEPLWKPQTTKQAEYLALSR